MEHPLPTGIFVEMSNEYENWTEKDFDDEIRRLKNRVKELKKLKKPKTLVPIQETDEDEDDDDDDDDIMHDPDVCEMVENGEHTCHIFVNPSIQILSSSSKLVAFEKRSSTLSTYS
jgi:hypothetical protein